MPKTAPPRDCEKFTIISYNILADYLAINHRSTLYFHIPRHILEWGWRKRNIIYELGLWSADILCLQEVDGFGELAEELKKMGYDGIWKMRTGSAVDGCAIFWRPSRFKLVYEESIQYNTLRLRDNVAQICVLEKLMRQNNIQTMSAVPMSSSSRWGCHITDNGLYEMSLAKCISNLTSVSLWGMAGIIDNGVVQLISRANSLQHLNIGGTFITDESLFAIADSCPHLKSIVLWSCRHVTEMGLLNLVNKCRKLESINIWGTRVPVECIVGLLTISPALRIKPEGALLNVRRVSMWPVA